VIEKNFVNQIGEGMHGMRSSRCEQASRWRRGRTSSMTSETQTDQ